MTNIPSSPFSHLVKELPSGAVLKEGNCLFPNQKILEITGYQPEEIATLDTWMKHLFAQRWEEFLHLYLTDVEKGFPQPRILPIQTANNERKWIEHTGFRNSGTEVWFIRDVSEFWRNRNRMLLHQRTLENNLFEQTEKLEQAVNMVLDFSRRLKEKDLQHRQFVKLIDLYKSVLQGIISQAAATDSPSIGCIISSLDQLQKCLASEDASGFELNQEIYRLETLLKG